MYFRVWCVIVFTLQSCCAVIYHLNDTEYHRIPPLFSLDEYESCLSEEGSTYCMLQLNLHAEPGNELMRMITEYSDQRVKHYNHSLIDRGVCVQKTCQNYISNTKTTEDLIRSLEACLNDSLRREYGLNARVSTLYYCDRHNEPRDIDGWDWAVLAVVLGLVAVNIVGSTYEYILSKHGGNNDKCETQADEPPDGNMFLLSFSVKRNWKWLTDTESSDPQFNLQYLHGARVILNICTVLAHVMIIFASGFTVNSHDFEKSFEDPAYLLIFNGLMIIQIFFFISGFLTVYKLSFEEETRAFTAWDVPKIIALRLIRLVPVLSVTLALTTTWVRHAGSGPLWKLYVTGSLVADCRNYWWHTLLFFNNYYMPDNKYCLIPTWQLAAEMQVFVVSVTAYMATRGRARCMVLGGLLLLSAAAPALHTALQDLDAIILTPEFYRKLAGSTFRFQQVPGHNNLPCFIMGMATAALLYSWQKKGAHLAKDRRFGLLQYLSVAAILLILYSGSVFYKDSARAPLLARTAYSAAMRLLLGLAFSLLLTALSLPISTLFKSVLEWRCWVVPSRLTYCVFLLHMILIDIAMGARMQLTYFSGFNLLAAHVCMVVASYLVSVPFYLLVEAPFTMFFKSYAKNRSAQASVGSKQAEKDKNI